MRQAWRVGDGVVCEGVEGSAKQAWLGAVWMELQGQAGLSRHGYWHGGARYDGVWRVQAGKVRLGIINSLTFVFLSND